MARKLNDKRYTVEQEYTGHISGRPRWVLRFCGERIDDYHKERSGWQAAAQHKADREAKPADPAAIQQLADKFT